MGSFQISIACHFVHSSPFFSVAAVYSIAWDRVTGRMVAFSAEVKQWTKEVILEGR